MNDLWINDVWFTLSVAWIIFCAYMFINDLF